MKTNIALTGFMGSGKTAVALALANLLGYKYISTDAFIEGNYGFNIPYIFEHEGEIRFRELEIQAIKRVSRENNTVIDCGGGVVLNTINVQRLREKSIIVYLYAEPRIIVERLMSEPRLRPLIKDKSIDDIKKIFAGRKPFYLSAAGIKIDTSNLDIDTVAQKIIRALKKHEDFNFKK